MRKFLYTLLCMMLVFTMMPMATGVAFAGTIEKSDWSFLSRAFNGEDPNEILVTVSNNEKDLFTVQDIEGVRHIKLLSDITASSTDSALAVSDTNIVLDLNGYVLDRGLIAADGTVTRNDHGSVIEVNGGELTIEDSNPTVEHEGYIDDNGLWHLGVGDGTPTSISGGIITGGTGKLNNDNNNYNGGGVHIDGGNLIVTGGNVIGNSADNGGGMHIDGKNCRMTGGNVIGNSAINGGGISIFLGVLSTFDSSITRNTATDKGGAIYTDKYNYALKPAINLTNCKINGNQSVWGGGIFMQKVEVTATNCKIFENTAASGGGGIEIETDGSTFNMNGGSIIDNIVKEVNNNLHKGAGVHFNDGAFTVCGEVNITNNKCNGVDSNVYLRKNPVIFDIAGMDTSSKIGIFAAGAEDKTETAIRIASGSDCLYCFTSDNTSHAVKINDGTEAQGDEYLELVPGFAITNEAPENEAENNKGYITVLPSAYNGETVIVTVTPNNGYELDTLTVKDASSTDITVTNNTFTMPAKAVIVTATFKKEEKPTPTYHGSTIDYSQYQAILEQAQKQQAELDAKKAEEEKIAEHEELVAEAKAALAETEFKATSTKQTKLNGKKAVKIKWEVVGGEYGLEDFEGFDVFRSTKKNSGYGKTPFFTTKNWTYTNNKDLKVGKTYYYKVRAWKMVDGEKVYTGWSTKAWRTVK